MSKSGTLGPGTCILCPQPFVVRRIRWRPRANPCRYPSGVVVDVTAPEDLGYTREQLLGQDIITLIPLQHRVAHYRGFSRWARDGEPTIMDRPLQLPGR